MKKVAILMAGGKSERLWPLSRTALPKQFLDMSGTGKTMIQMTVDRLSSLIAPEDIYIVTNRAYAPIVKGLLPKIPAENVLEEPQARNTAPCVAYATAVLQAKYDEAAVFVLASDHMIDQQEHYLEDLRRCADFVERKDALVTIGITPTYPEIGYGYIRYDAAREPVDGLYPVAQFVEKPDLPKAEEYLKSGNYVWNSGMFVWRLSVIAKHFEALLPGIHQGMCTLREACGSGQLSDVLDAVFEAFEPISIDYGIMEKAEDIYVLPSSFSWLDVGSWNAMPRLKGTDDTGNVMDGQVVHVDTEDTVVYSRTGRLIVLHGLKNAVVVDTDDVVFVCDRSVANNMKPVIAKVRADGHDDKL